MLGITLNLAGLFSFYAPAAAGRVSGQHSVLTGMLAVVVATPCTAPFMGGAVAAALIAPVGTALGIFLALGLGMALPFLALALIPWLAHFVPRPGAWMVWLQRVLSVPMFATFCWLAWVLHAQAGAAGLGLFGLGAGLLFLALARKNLRPLALGAVLVLPFLHGQTAAARALTLPGAQPYSEARLAALRAAQKPVFVDLTAAWCVTCLVNEAATLSAPAVQSAFAAHRVTLLVGDWTDRDAGIAALLRANQRDGVPLYLYYAPGSAGPVVLPQILDARVVEAAVSEQ